MAKPGEVGAGFYATLLARVPILVLLLALPVATRRQPYRNVEGYDHNLNNAMNNRYKHSPVSGSSSSSSSSSSYLWNAFSSALPPVQCYSCMSESYDPFMNDMLAQGYRKQDVVTNRCNEPFFPRGIPYVNCSNICVTMKETIHVGGIRVLPAYIRGCLDKILDSRYRFNETALLTYNFYRKDHCRDLPRAMLISDKFHGNVNFCACYGNRCNKAAISGRNAGQLFISYLLDFLHWSESRTLLRAQSQVTSWLVLIASSSLHFGMVALIRWILLT